MPTDMPYVLIVGLECIVASSGLPTLKNAIGEQRPVLKQKLNMIRMQQRRRMGITLGRSKRKRAAARQNQLDEVNDSHFNDCLCGSVVIPASDGALACKQVG